MRGWAKKTALALISQFETLAGVYENIASEAIRPAVRAKLENDKEKAEMSRMLAEIVTNVPVPQQTQDYLPGPGNPAAAARLLASLEMETLRKKLQLDAAAALPQQADAPALPQCTPAPLPGKLPLGDSCIALAGDGFVIVAQGVVYTASATDAAFLHLLADTHSAKRVFDAKALYTLALAAGSEAQNIVFDGKLAAYLLNPAGGGYDPGAPCGRVRRAAGICL